VKIGFFGNTNNYPFILARAMRQLGHEVLFVINRPEPLHRPEARYADMQIPYPEWVRDVGTVNPRDVVRSSASRTAAVKLLAGCDAVILNELGPALLPRIGRPGIALLTGSDLMTFADYKSVANFEVSRGNSLIRKLYGRWLGTRIICAQRAGIAEATAVGCYLAKGMHAPADVLFNDIGVRDQQRFFFMMTDTDRHAGAPAPKNSILRVVCVTRHEWLKPLTQGLTEIDDKRSDVMIRGIGLFHRTSGRRLDIRLVKKGSSYEASMRLAESEGIADQITWMNEMPQAQASAELRQADIVFEQFGVSGIGMSALEAMSLGRPVIMNARPEIYEPILGCKSPICQARTPEEVCGHLEALTKDAGERERVGQASREYVERFFSARAAAKTFLQRLGA
jgi:glycosyltransferase involved in cell wall biosynthesis